MRTKELVNIEGVLYRLLVNLDNDYSVSPYLIEERWYEDKGFKGIRDVNSSTEEGQLFENEVYELLYGNQVGNYKVIPLNAHVNLSV